ncbi:MAG: hypothetical protein HY401_03020 [Elusimicrobia bacterium]|nr:hypothetical protein [Elusimicrobiota bacterium]
MLNRKKLFIAIVAALAISTHAQVSIADSLLGDSYEKVELLFNGKRSGIYFEPLILEAEMVTEANNSLLGVKVGGFWSNKTDASKQLVIRRLRLEIPGTRLSYNFKPIIDGWDGKPLTSLEIPSGLIKNAIWTAAGNVKGKAWGGLAAETQAVLSVSLQVKRAVAKLVLPAVKLTVRR